MKIALGTAQFGFDYGVSNVLGQTTQEEAQHILHSARKYGVDVIDTAPLYGTSEEVLGGILAEDYGQIVTKTIQFQNNKLTGEDAANLLSSFEQSLKSIRRTKLYGLLVHDADDLLKSGGQFLYDALVQLKEQGSVDKIGVSLYTGAQIDRILDQYHVDIIQLPINIFDQRLILGGQLLRLKEHGVEIHARSVFLQGLLLMEPNSLPSYFDPIKKHLETYHAFIVEHGLSPVQAALGFACSLDEIDRVVCGVNTNSQWLELIAASHHIVNTSQLSKFAINDALMLDPSNWQT